MKMNVEASSVPTPTTKQDLLDRVRLMAPEIAQRALQTDADRKVSRNVIQQMKDAQLLEVILPRSIGGLELEFSAFSMITRELGRACGSTGWVFAVLAESAWIAAFFPEESQAELWAGPGRPVVCASIIPSGTAKKVDGGYRVSGKWAYLSGSDHADWVILSVISDQDIGKGNVVDILVRRTEIELLDDWQVMGLTATGSNSALVNNLFVPDSRTIFHGTLLDGTAPGRSVHPDFLLARVPRGLVTCFALSPVIVGLATRALEVCEEILRTQNSAPALPDWGSIQSRFAEAVMDAEMANHILTAYTERNDQIVNSGRHITERDVAHNRLAASHMVRLAKQAIDKLIVISGSKWIYNSNIMQLIVRDASAAATHRSLAWDVNSITFCKSIGLFRT